ncbi:MAG: biotin/lipoyl-containing protein [Chloroflexota bacterium]
MIYQYGTVSYAISLQPLGAGHYRATIGDRQIDLIAEPFEGGWLLTINGERLRVYAASHARVRWLSLEGETYSVPEAETHRRSASARESDLTAQMPGQVREISVHEGENVKSGQTLLVLEAMKMEIRISVPADGRVKRLLVKAGDVVDRGQHLVEMEEAQS